MKNLKYDHNTLFISDNLKNSETQFLSIIQHQLTPASPQGFPGRPSALRCKYFEVWTPSPSETRPHLLTPEQSEGRRVRHHPRVAPSVPGGGKGWGELCPTRHKYTPANLPITKKTFILLRKRSLKRNTNYSTKVIFMLPISYL